jgi:uncharacterized membrane protein YcaP (DUF421 family)
MPLKMDAFWNFVGPLLGLGVEPKELTFGQISLRGIIVMIFTLIIIRLGDKRSLSKKSAFDAALLIILASVLARAINGSSAFFATLGGGAVLVALHRLLAFASCKSPAFRRLIKGEPSELVRDGEFIRSNMRRDHVADEDVCEDLRLDGEEELAKVKVARLECSGDISFIKKEQ